MKRATLTIVVLLVLAGCGDYIERRTEEVRQTTVAEGVGLAKTPAAAVQQTAQAGVGSVQQTASALGGAAQATALALLPTPVASAISLPQPALTPIPPETRAFSAEEVSFRNSLAAEAELYTVKEPQYLGGCILFVFCSSGGDKLLIGLLVAVGKSQAEGLCERVSFGSAEEIEQDVICGAGRLAGSEWLENRAYDAARTSLSVLLLPFKAYSTQGQAVLATARIMIDQIGADDPGQTLLKSVAVETLTAVAPEGIKEYLDTTAGNFASGAAADGLLNFFNRDSNTRALARDKQVRGPYRIVRVSLAATYNPKTHYVVATIASSELPGTIFIVRYLADKEGFPVKETPVTLLKCTDTQPCVDFR